MKKKIAFIVFMEGFFNSVISAMITHFWKTHFTFRTYLVPKAFPVKKWVGRPHP